MTGAIIILSLMAIGLLACTGVGIANTIGAIKEKFWDIAIFSSVVSLCAISVTAFYIHIAVDYYRNPHPIHEIEATSAQIDTIVTQCGEKQDTTYVIKYIK